MIILLVDDDLFICAYLQHVLRSRGHHVVECDHGADALERVKILRFDLAVVDMVMPVMGGIELIGHLREKYPELAIVGITGGSSSAGNTGQSHLEQMKMAGADEVLEKPFEEKDFINTIKAAIAHHDFFNNKK